MLPRPETLNARLDTKWKVHCLEVWAESLQGLLHRQVRCVNQILLLRNFEELFAFYGEDRYRPNPLLRKVAREKSKFIS